MQTPITARPIQASEIVTPPDRQRKTFEEVAILELANSIKKYGLFHAIQVRQDGKTLVSGECRLRAISQHLLPLGIPVVYAGHTFEPGAVPVVMAKSDDPLELEEIELMENQVRTNLSWQEQAEAHARLHALRQAQMQQAVKLEITHGEGDSWKAADTAREIHGEALNNSRQDEVAKEIIVSRYLDRPEVHAAPTLKDAFKVIKKMEEADRNRALAIAVGKVHTSALHRVFNENCLDWMARPENAGQFDVILTDPPYGMGADTFGDAGGKMAGIEHHYDDSYLSWTELMDKWCDLSYQIAKPQAHAYVFCDIARFTELKQLMEIAGWYVFRTPLTNYKQNSGRVPLPDRGPRRQSEWCLYAIKGNKLVNYIASDVIVTGSDENLTHGAQKPVALYLDLLRRSAKPGDKVIDTFGGTGTLIPAAHELKCEATVVEQNQEYYGLCLGRLSALDDKQGELAV